MKNKINIIIPSAGNGLRFKEKGFKRYKPFIFLDCDTMIKKIINGFQSKKYKISIFVILKKSDYFDYKKDIDQIENQYKNTKFVAIDFETEGTICTILSQFDLLLNSNEPLLLANCDQLAIIDFDEFLDESIKYDGSLLIFNENSDKNWSYVDIKDGFVTRVVDKEPISNFAILGWYFWKSSITFLKYSIEMIIHNDRTKNEFMQNKPYNYAISDGLKIKPIFIDNKNVVALGTPEDLEKYYSKLK